jgi:hypothetical protein
MLYIYDIPTHENGTKTIVHVFDLNLRPTFKALLKQWPDPETTEATLRLSLQVSFVKFYQVV